MEHPNKKQRENQKNFLASLPEDQREEHARLFRFGNAAYIYHHQSEEFEPTETDFKEWLEGLPLEVRNDFEKRGFEDCRGVVSFTRYVMEKNDIGMDEWMKKHLSESDYKEFHKVIEERKKSGNS
jgi:hypothetical protein